MCCVALSYGQFTNNHTYSNSNTIENPLGAVHPQKGFILPFLDTLNNPAVSYNGAVVQSPADSKPYYSDGSRWIPFITGAEPTQINFTYLAGKYLTDFNTFGTLITDSIVEGLKLFYTATRARSAISALLPLSYNSVTGVMSADTVTYLATLYNLKRDSQTLATAITTAVNNIPPKWDLAGNAVTSGVSRLGSINNASLSFITNGVEHMRLDSVGANLYIGNTSGAGVYPLNDISQLIIGSSKTNFKGSYFLLNSATPSAFNDSGSALRTIGNYEGKSPLNPYLRFRSADSTVTLDHIVMDRYGRTVVGSGVGLIPNAYAQLEIRTTTGGFLPPKMNTAQAWAIGGGKALSNIPIGMLIYNTDSAAICIKASGVDSIWSRMAQTTGTTPSSGTVTNIATPAGSFMLGGPITNTGSLSVDTFNLFKYTPVFGGTDDSALSNRYFNTQSKNFTIDSAAIFTINGKKLTDSAKYASLVVQSSGYSLIRSTPTVSNSISNVDDSTIRVHSQRPGSIMHDFYVSPKFALLTANASQSVPVKFALRVDSITLDPGRIAFFDGDSIKRGKFDTANIKPRFVAGTNVTFTGTYPNITISSSGGTGGGIDSVRRVSRTDTIIRQFTGGVGTYAFRDNGLVDSVKNVSATVQRVYFSNGTTQDNTFQLDSIFHTGDVIGRGLLTIADSLANITHDWQITGILTTVGSAARFQSGFQTGTGGSSTSNAYTTSGNGLMNINNASTNLMATGFPVAGMSSRFNFAGNTATASNNFGIAGINIGINPFGTGSSGKHPFATSLFVGHTGTITNGGSRVGIGANLILDLPSGSALIDSAYSMYSYGDVFVNAAITSNKLNVLEGSNASIGTATLSAGTVTVTTSKCSSTSRVFTQLVAKGAGNTGAEYLVVAGSGSFVLTSINTSGSTATTDTSTLNWWIIN